MQDVCLDYENYLAFDFQARLSTSILYIMLCIHRSYFNLKNTLKHCAGK